MVVDHETAAVVGQAATTDAPAIELVGAPPALSFDLAQIYAEHGAIVYSYARRTCSPALAADITQDVFTTLWLRKDRFDPARGTMRSLLVTMAHHRAVDIVRSEEALRQREERHRSESSRSVASEPVDGLLIVEQGERVNAAMDRLNPDVREAISMAVHGGLTYRQIAVQLGLPEGTIKSRIRIGLRQLRWSLVDERA